ncbi:CBU_0592 family membrane protein [Jatrophihabitans sp. DSM 45814]
MFLYIQLFGSLLVLVSFVAAQLGRLEHASPVYLLLNVLGSAALGLSALAEAQWGFVVLEGVWAAVSGWSLARTRRSRLA